MIDLKLTWIPQIIRYAEIVSNYDLLHGCWVLRKCKHTSVVSFDEMFEQIFDDLDSDNQLERMENDISNPRILVEAIRNFLKTIKDVNAVVERNVELSAPEALLSSSFWRSVTSSAATLIDVGSATGFGAELR